MVPLSPLEIRYTPEMIAPSKKSPTKLPSLRELFADMFPPSTSPSPKPTAKRKRTTAYQLEVLTHTFACTQYPAAGLRQKLAEQLDMAPQAVLLWFQNKRKALRSRSRDSTHSQEK